MTSPAAARDVAVKKKHVRFATMEDDGDDDNDDQEEDTLFDKRKDTERGLKSALKAAKRATKPGCDARVEVVGGGRGRHGACGRWTVTLALCGSFLGLGMSISVLGPTFEDLAVNVKRNISNISYIFVGRSAGYLGGSLLGGILFDCMDPHLLLGLSMLVTACGMCAIPFCKQALLLTGLMSSIGMSMGVLDTGGNVLVLSTWGARAGPHVQALHFSFAAGAFVSPIIAKLLFGPDGNGSAASDSAAARHIHGRSSTLRSMWAYVAIGSFVLLVALLFFALYSRGAASRDKSHAAAGGRPAAARHHAALVALLSLFFFAYVGAEVAYGSFIFTHAKEYAGLPAAQAAGLNSLFWAAFAACRGLAVCGAACAPPAALLVLSLAGSTASALLLCLFSRERAALWLCTALYGASMAATFPSGISWAEQHTAVTGRAAAAFVAGAALGEMALPALVGLLLGRFRDRPLLMYVALAAAAFASVLFPVMYKLASAPAGPAAGASTAGRNRRPRARGRPDADDDSEFRQALLDSGANEEEEEEEEEEQEENEADQWNDADFEVIEMDDTVGLVGSPGLPSSPAEPADADSPGRQPLLALDREKRD